MSGITCHGHEHIAIQTVRFKGHPLGQMLVSQTLAEGHALASQLGARSDVAELEGIEHLIWLN